MSETFADLRQHRERELVNGTETFTSKYIRRKTFYYLNHTQKYDTQSDKSTFNHRNGAYSIYS